MGKRGEAGNSGRWRGRRGEEGREIGRRIVMSISFPKEIYWGESMTNWCWLNQVMNGVLCQLTGFCWGNRSPFW